MPTDGTPKRFSTNTVHGIRKYQVFVSSTYEDLREDREAVAWEILKTGHIPVGMENFSASDDRGWEVITSYIDLSDYYVVILAGRYGSVIEPDGISWTEREYRYAVEKGIPVLAFIRNRKAISGDKIDVDEKARKLALLENDLKSGRLCEPWTTTDDLRSKVSLALLKSIAWDEAHDKARPGWYRGNEISLAAAAEVVHLSTENRELRAEVRMLKAVAQFSPEIYFRLEKALIDALKHIEIGFNDLIVPITDAQLTRIWADSDAHTALKQFLNYVESYALSVRSGVIDREIAYRTMPDIITRWSMVFAPFIAKMRADRGHPDTFIELELLASEWRAWTAGS